MSCWPSPANGNQEKRTRFYYRGVCSLFLIVFSCRIQTSKHPSIDAKDTITHWISSQIGSVSRTKTLWLHSTFINSGSVQYCLTLFWNTIHLWIVTGLTARSWHGLSNRAKRFSLSFLRLPLPSGGMTLIKRNHTEESWSRLLWFVVILYHHTPPCWECFHHYSGTYNQRI